MTDVVKLAGGFTDDADKKSVNLAEKVADEAVIYVARVGEEVTPASTRLKSKIQQQVERSKMRTQHKSILILRL